MARSIEKNGNATPNPLLAVKQLHVAYDQSEVLRGISFDIFQGEVVTLLGRNGAGKTTALKGILGIARHRQGSVQFESIELIRMTTEKIARCGIAYCPEERGIFSSLSVEENLLLPPIIRPNGMSVADIYKMFPNLLERRNSIGTKLSGGEQQMLAIGRILRTGAPLLLLDEPTEGLAPAIVKKIGVVLKELKARGLTILLVEQNLHFAADIADRHYILENGHVVSQIRAEDLSTEKATLNKYLGL